MKRLRLTRIDSEQMAGLQLESGEGLSSDRGQGSALLQEYALRRAHSGPLRISPCFLGAGSRSNPREPKIGQNRALFCCMRLSVP